MSKKKKEEAAQEEVKAAEETAQEPEEKDEKEEKIKALEADAEAQKEKYMRLAAEYDNYRKRTQREKEGIYGDAKMDTIKKFLAVYDNLERGVAQYAEGDAHRQGLELIAKQFMDVLAGLGVTEIEALNQPFDPEKHNAVMHVEDEAIEESTVVEVFQKGFMLGEKVLRFSMVKVAN